MPQAIFQMIALIARLKNFSDGIGDGTLNHGSFCQAGKIDDLFFVSNRIKIGPEAISGCSYQSDQRNQTRYAKGFGADLAPI